MAVTTDQNRGYFPRLNAIRGAALLWVLVFHFCGAIWGWDVAAWPQRFSTESGWIAVPGWVITRIVGAGGVRVPIFFVLSGFLIHLTFSRGANQGVLAFWFKRWGRIYPPYFVALLVFAVLYGAPWTAKGRNDLLTHMLLIHTFADRTFFSINGSFWSLAHEFQFYLLYPLLLVVRRWLGIEFLLGISLATRFGIGIYVQLTPGQFADDPALALVLPRLYFEWILGMFVADRFLAGRPAFPFGVKAGWLLLVFSLITSGFPWWNIASAPAISLAAAIWIDRVIHGSRAPTWIERRLIPLGVISYSAYLWHQPIVEELSARILGSTSGAAIVGIAGLTVIAFIVSSFAAILVACGAYQLVELPSVAFVKAMLGWWTGQGRAGSGEMISSGASTSNVDSHSELSLTGSAGKQDVRRNAA